MREREFISRLLKPLATSNAARGLNDDAAVWLPPLGRELVLTHDVLAAGVHYLPDDPPSDVAWKLLAVNLSDLAAMGAKPAGVLMGLALGPAQDEAWLAAFTDGLRRAMDRWGVALWGGDTVRVPGEAVLGLTAVGTVERGQALARSGARAGDELWVSGTIGDAGLGLAVARGDADFDKALLARYRRPEPRLALGAALAGIATACMDVSDGLLIDAGRLAAASGVGVTVKLGAISVSEAAAARVERDDAGLLRLATAGDDYELLFAVPAGTNVSGLATAKVRLTRVGRFVAGEELTVTGLSGEPIVPERLGWEH